MELNIIYIQYNQIVILQKNMHSWLNQVVTSFTFDHILALFGNILTTSEEYKLSNIDDINLRSIGGVSINVLIILN